MVRADARKTCGGNTMGALRTVPRVAFYTRISTDEDHQRYSLDAQKDRLEAFCKAQYDDDWTLHKLYRDTESGTHMNRPGLEEMLFDAEARAFDVLLVFRVDRLSRKVRELALMVDELTKNGVTLKSITEPFDTSNAAGKMMLQMLGVFAEFEHATIVERTRVGLERKAKTGNYVGGNVPYGYRLDDDKHLVIHEEEALIVRKMFTMYALGREGASTICTKLNDAGLRNRNGRKWGRRVVLYMLKNPAYVGKIRWREVLYEGKHDPIVSDVLFEKAREVLDDRHEDLKGRQWHNGDERLLTGVIKCGLCNSHMFGGGGQKNGRYIPYYVCSKRFNDHACKQDYVRAELLESAIVQDIKAMFRDEDFMARVWEEANRRLGAEKPDLEKEIARVEAEAAKVRASVERYFEAFEAGTLKAELCNQKVADLQGRMEALETERRDLEVRRERLELPAIDRDMLAALVDNFEEVLAEAPVPQKKHLLHRLVKKVLIHDRRTVEVWYALPNARRFEDWHKKLPE
ncbi:MAG: recombinase family protein [Pseudomonadales bacterium]|nr:recombinase family protein [Pseudomonadales bacterium]